MPRIYCSRYPSYTLWNRDVRYQFKDGVCEVDEAGLAFFQRQPMWGRLFTEAPVPETPPNPVLWKVEKPTPLPPVPPRDPENAMDTPLNRMLGWPHLPIYGSSRQFAVVSRQGPPVRLSQEEILGHGAPVPDLLRERSALAPQRRPSPTNSQRHPAPQQQAPPISQPFIPRKRSSPKADRAAAWLKNMLRDRPLPATWITQQAKAVRISAITLKRARAALGIVAIKHGMAGGWAWMLPVTPNDALQAAPANVKIVPPGA